MWADHLRFVDPKRFGGGDVSPQLSELVRWRIDILNQKYAATVTTRGMEFVAGVAAFTAYGRDTRRKMMRSLLDESRSRYAPKSKCELRDGTPMSCFPVGEAYGSQKVRGCGDDSGGCVTAAAD